MDRLTKLFQTRAMALMGWTSVPKETGEWYRASGSVLCSCGIAYARHPLDVEVLSYAGDPIFHVLCNGDRVKL